MMKRSSGGNRWWRTSGLSVVLVLTGALIVGGCDDDGGNGDGDMTTDVMMDSTGGDTSTTTPDTSETTADTTDTSVDDMDTTTPDDMDTSVDDMDTTTGDMDTTTGDMDTTDTDMAVTCGNGTIDAGEVCDGTELDGEDCTTQGFDSGTLACNATCDGFDTSACMDSTVVLPSPNCGNGVAEPEYYEGCDGADVGGIDCTAGGWASGTLSCTADCRYDTSACTGNEPVAGWTCLPSYYGDGGCDCGCGVVDVDCADDTAASCEYCGNIGACDSGSFDCANIDAADNSTCAAAPVGTCGDGVAEGYEACDTDDLRFIEAPATCDQFTDQNGAPLFPGGTLGCTSECRFDYTDCSVCGDGTVGDGESCEGTDVGAATCQSLGFESGTLACAADSCSFDTSGCVVPTGWTCDMSYFGTADGCDCGCGITDPDCNDASAASCQFCNNAGSCGEGAADGDCTFIDMNDNSLCADTCGDGTADTLEECDGSDLRMATCADLGYTGTTLACATDCTYDLTGCGTQAMCGDDTAEANEVCDGTDLDSMSCTDLGFSGGTLACETDCGGFDTSACTIPAAWTCDATYYSDGSFCDCGCGVLDPDCADATVGSCDANFGCGSTGSCNEGDSACTMIDPANNAVCL